MTYPLPLFNQRIYRYLSDFINLPPREIDFIGNKYVASKFLRTGCNIGFSVGRYYRITDNGETADVNEISIEELCGHMESEFLKWEWLFIKLREFPEMKQEFRKTFAN